MNNVFLGVIIPTYMERDNIVNLLENLQNTLSNSNIDYRILVVDDNSPDGTAEVVKKYVKAGGR
ncbi:MAG: glycosyltransferase, partial [Desulfurococcaceae archaeon]